MHAEFSTCKLAACQIERKFAEELVEIGFQDVYDPALKGMVGRGECVKIGESTNSGSHKFDSIFDDTDGTFFNCCGSYPKRFPFLDGGVRRCCDDGKVRFDGDC